MNKDNLKKYATICQIAEEKYGKDWIDAKFGSRVSRIMDIESADMEFNLRLDELIDAANTSEYDFCHDVFGIWSESNRATFPATFGLFVPRFSGEKR